MFGCLRTVVESWHLQCLLSHFYTASSSRYSTHALGLASLNHLAFLGIYSMALEFPEFYGLHYNIIYNIGFIFSFLKWPLRNSLQNPNMATHFLAWVDLRYRGVRLLFSQLFIAAKLVPYTLCCQFPHKLEIKLGFFGEQLQQPLFALPGKPFPRHPFPKIGIPFNNILSLAFFPPMHLHFHSLELDIGGFWLQDTFLFVPVMSMSF